MQKPRIFVAFLALALTAIVALSTPVMSPVVAQANISENCLGTPAILSTGLKGVDKNVAYGGRKVLIFVEKSNSTVELYGAAYTPSSGALPNDHWYQPPTCKSVKDGMEAAVRAKPEYKNFKLKWSGVAAYN